jgi:hypothetical protein
MKPKTFVTLVIVTMFVCVCLYACGVIQIIHGKHWIGLFNVTVNAVMLTVNFYTLKSFIKTSWTATKH